MPPLPNAHSLLTGNFVLTNREAVREAVAMGRVEGVG